MIPESKLWRTSFCGGKEKSKKCAQRRHFSRPTKNGNGRVQTEAAKRQLAACFLIERKFNDHIEKSQSLTNFIEQKSDQHQDRCFGRKSCYCACNIKIKLRMSRFESSVKLGLQENRFFSSTTKLALMPGLLRRIVESEHFCRFECVDALLRFVDLVSSAGCPEALAFPLTLTPPPDRLTRSGESICSLWLV